MKIPRCIYGLGLMLGLLLPSMAAAEGVPHTFTANTPAKADEVNANFTALLEKIAALEARIRELEESPAQEMAAFVEVYPTPSEVPLDTGANGPLIRFVGANVQIVSGAGTTNARPNGLGNLIVGYDEWFGDNGEKSGSHNLVVGDGHNYSRYGGLVVGRRNSITGDYASVSGGQGNIASGAESSVSGGRGNEAGGHTSSVSGGVSNEASGVLSSISGGQENIASGSWSMIGGGMENEASGQYTSILGAARRKASENYQMIPPL